MVDFEYASLDDAATEIRLLYHEKLSDSSQLQFRLETWPLDQSPEFCAISYVWGDPEPQESIRINDQDFYVGVNAHYALSQVTAREDAGEVQRYWMDAICINQQNLPEKAQQVMMMGGIFKRASQVLACVGQESDDSARLFAFIRELMSHLDPHDESEQGREDHIQYMRGRLDESPERECFIKAISAFGKRNYWSRLWILPEVAIPLNPLLLCGRECALFNSVDDFAIAARRSASIKTDMFQRVQVLKNYGLSVGSDHWALDALIMWSWPFHCLNRLDHIYGILPLIGQRADLARIQVDYTITKADLLLKVLPYYVGVDETHVISETQLKFLRRALDLNVSEEQVQIIVGRHCFECAKLWLKAPERCKCAMYFVFKDTFRPGKPKLDTTEAVFDDHQCDCHEECLKWRQDPHVSQWMRSR